MSDNSRGTQEWQRYISSLSAQDAHHLQAHYLSTTKALSRQNLAQGLYRLLASDKFLQRARLNLSGDEPRVIASLYHHPSSFDELLKLVPLAPLQLGMTIASLRSQLLVARGDDRYFLPFPVEQGLHPPISDLMACSPDIPIPACEPPWLSEALLLASASFFLQNEKTDEVFASKMTPIRQRILLDTLQRSHLLVDTGSGYKPLLPPSSLTRLSRAHRGWQYWGWCCNISAATLYQTLWPIHRLPPFEQRSWFRWLHRFPSIAPAGHQHLTNTLVQLDLLVAVDECHLAANPYLAHIQTDSDPHQVPVFLPAVLEFHLSAEQLQLPLAALTLCCRIQHFDRVAVFAVDPRLLRQVCAALGAHSQFDDWVALTRQAGITLDPLAEKQLRLMHQDGQRARFWEAVPVLVCDDSLNHVVKQLPGVSDYLLSPPSGNVFIFDPHKEGWRKLLTQAGIELRDHLSPPSPPQADIPDGENWPPPSPAFDLEAKARPTSQHPTPFGHSALRKRHASGLNYHAKKQLLASLIDGGEQLAAIDYLGRDNNPLILLPLSLEKNEQGYTLTAYDINDKVPVQLDVGKMLRVHEHHYAMLSEPLRKHLQQATPAKDT